MESLRLHRGFSLIEMLVVLVIIVTITSIALVRQSSFNKTLVIANTAYDIALTLRSAETFGLGSRAVGATANTGYGVNFSGTPTKVLTLFADTNPGPSTAPGCHQAVDTSTPDARPGNCVYEASYGTGQSERVTSYTLGNNITISKFCAFTTSWVCSPTLASLNVVFARPNPKAFMSVNGSYSVSSPVTRACLTITSPQGGFRYVSISSSGEIIANAPSCP